MTAKSIYQFYHNGSACSIAGLKSMYDSGQITKEEYEQRLEYYDSWLQSEIPKERKWRNSEYASTDWMLLPDATFKKTELANSSLLASIMEYRQKLKAYNLTTDDRPERPEWFKGYIHQY